MSERERELVERLDEQEAAAQLTRTQLRWLRNNQNRINARTLDLLHDQGHEALVKAAQETAIDQLVAEREAVVQYEQQRREARERGEWLPPRYGREAAAYELSLLPDPLTIPPASDDTSWELHPGPDDTPAGK